MIYKIFIATKSALLIRKNRKLFQEKKHRQIYFNLERVYDMHKNINVTLDKSYLYWLQKIDLDFRTHKYTEIEKNIEIAINSVDYTSSRVSVDTKKYRKAFLYSILFLVSLFKNNKEKALEVQSLIQELAKGVKGLPENILFDRTVYYKERIEKLFEENLYYKDNYSEDKLSEVLVAMENIDQYTDKFFQKIEKDDSKIIFLQKIMKIIFLLIVPMALFILLMFKGMILLAISVFFLWIVLLYIYNDYLNK